MPITCTRENRVMTAEITGEVDHHRARALMEELAHHIDADLPRDLTLDLGGVTFMDSSGIGVIMGRYKLVKKRGGSITVTNINNSIDRIFTISGLYKIVSKTETPSLVKW